MSDHLTKTRILDAAEELLLEKNFQSVSLNEILTAVKISKGCFYHHFESKESFGCELIKHYAEDSRKTLSQLLLNRKMEPNARLRILALHESRIAKFISNNGKCPCLLVKLASETSFSSPTMRKEISLAYSRLGELYEEVIQEGQEHGYIGKQQDAKFIASLITSLWLGAVEKALIHQKVDSLRDALEFISSNIIAPQSAFTKSA